MVVKLTMSRNVIYRVALENLALSQCYLSELVETGFTNYNHRDLNSLLPRPQCVPVCQHALLRLNIACLQWKNTSYKALFGPIFRAPRGTIKIFMNVEQIINLVI